jgi:dimethylargininase
VFIALTREVSPNLGRCELTHLQRQTIDLAIARAQHRNYEDCLSRLGYEIHHVPAAPDLPDSVFVEDTCVVFPHMAVVTWPGADSRKVETAAVADVMRQFRPLRFIRAPATLDGGDVLCVGKRVFVGLSNRTNSAGVAQLQFYVAAQGYTVVPVRVAGCLHLKSAATAVAESTILVNPAWIDANVFADLTKIEVDPSEVLAANALLARGIVVYPNAFPRTRKRLEERGIAVETVDVSELAKAEGGVTCCSLLFEAE